MSDRITAMDIEKQAFKRAFRGYEPEDVQLYLRSVAEEVERLNLTNAELREELGELRRKNEEHRGHERTLQKTLVSAQKMAGNLEEQAKSEAESIIRNARQKAERVLQENQDQLTRLEAEISRCKLERDLFEKRLRNMIEEHSDLLERRHERKTESDNLRLVPRRRGLDAG